MKIENETKTVVAREPTNEKTATDILAELGIVAMSKEDVANAKNHVNSRGSKNYNRVVEMLEAMLAKNMQGGYIEKPWNEYLAWYINKKVIAKNDKFKVFHAKTNGGKVLIFRIDG